MDCTRPLAVMVAALLIAGCGSAGAPSRHELIDSRDNYDPRSLDPALSTDVPTGRAVGYIFDGLTRFDPDAKVEPALAERWEVSPDGLTYTFHLHQGVTFHDGSHFTAANVVKSWQRALDPATKSGAAQFLFPIRGAREFNAGKASSLTGVVVRDDSTLVVTLTEPLAIFIKMLAMPVAAIVPDHVSADFGEHPIGTGPWKLVEWKHDDYLLFARNPSYFGGAPATDGLRARIIAEPSTAVAEYESGNVDVLEIPADEAADWQDDESKKPMLMSTPALELVYVAINTTRGPLADVRVRQALNYAIDINRIIEISISGRGTRAAGVIPPALAGYDSTRKPYSYDPQKAKQLLAAAGYPNGIDIELWTSTTPIYLRMAETMQAYLNASGIRTKIVQRESASARAAARKGQADLFLKDWYADYPDAEDFLYPLLHSANKGAGGNVSFYANPLFDSVVTQSRRELDETKRDAMYRQADSIAFAGAPMIFLYFYNELYAVQPWVKHFVPPVIFNGQRWTNVTIDTTRH
ncbi:MAG TPA: ABC transporter substrate-binding protein [Gemmatimonadaceae bacterium]|jgi:peptide/nickel transport system substrate-binding protein/oligopeptide transport system substrate-binding protein